jgi:DNA-binding MarR family transcriptional regulator
MTDEPTDPPPANSAFRVLAALADLGEATAAAIAEKAGLGYSTVTPKLRAWEDAGQAEMYHNEHTSQRLWRLTEAGMATTATPTRHTIAPTGGGTDPAPAPTKPASRRRAATVEPEQQRRGTDEPDAADPVRSDDGDPAAPTPPPDTAPDDGTQPTAAPAAATSAEDRADAPPTGAADDQPAPGDDDTNEATSDSTSEAVPKRRRPKGALEASALKILQANPGTEYKVGEMKTAIDDADADTGYPRASEGATSNALDKLARENKAVRVEGRKAATFQLASTTD